jgi:hypothetical protein
MYFGMGKTYHNSYHFPWFLQSLRNITIISVYLLHQISALFDNPISQVNTIKYNKKNIFEMNFYKQILQLLVSWNMMVVAVHPQKSGIYKILIILIILDTL